MFPAWVQSSVVSSKSVRHWLGLIAVLDVPSHVLCVYIRPAQPVAHEKRDVR
jgi:hypothetical protein